MRSLAAVAVTGVLAVPLLLVAVAPTSAVAQTAPAVEQCNSVDNTPGLALECSVTVVNNLDLVTGATSSTVTVEECHGAANAPQTRTCETTVRRSTQLVTSVSQCNYAVDGGGATLRCTVSVTNKIRGTATSTPATVNQCNGSGAEGTEPTLNCSPFPASVTGATITQCNGSANGGGASRRVTCTVPTSRQSAALAVRINQCNNSANGGGSTVTCSATLTQNIVAGPAATPTATPTSTVTLTARATTTPTSTRTLTAPGGPATTPPATSVVVPSTPATQLPRTGPHTTSLGMAGLLTLLLGIVLVAASRETTRHAGTHRR